MRQWKKVLSGLAIIVGVIMLTSLLWDDSEQEPPEQVMREELTSSERATPQPAPREWTAEEMVERAPPTRGPMSDCEVALSLAYLDTMRVMREELTASERATVEGHKVNLAGIEQIAEDVMADRVTSVAEATFQCEVAPQQVVQMQDAVRDLRALGPGLLGLETDMLRALRYVTDLQAVCEEDLAGGAGG